MALYMQRESSYVETAAQTPYPTDEHVSTPISTRITLASGGCAQGIGCSGGAIHIPTAGCDDCEDFAQELALVKNKVLAIEDLIGNKVNTIISMTDANNNEVSVTVLAE